MWRQIVACALTGERGTPSAPVDIFYEANKMLPSIIIIIHCGLQWVFVGTSLQPGEVFFLKIVTIGPYGKQYFHNNVPMCHYEKY